MELKAEHIEKAQHTTYTVHISYSIVYAMCDSMDIAKDMLKRCAKKHDGCYIVEQLTSIVTTVHREAVVEVGLKA